MSSKIEAHQKNDRNAKLHYKTSMNTNETTRSTDTTSDDVADLDEDGPATTSVISGNLPAFVESMGTGEVTDKSFEVYA